jgi:hypothetical protein
MDLGYSSLSEQCHKPSKRLSQAATLLAYALNVLAIFLPIGISLVPSRQLEKNSSNVAYTQLCLSWLL